MPGRGHADSLFGLAKHVTDTLTDNAPLSADQVNLMVDACLQIGNLMVYAVGTMIMGRVVDTAPRSGAKNSRHKHAGPGSCLPATHRGQDKEDRVNKALQAPDTNRPSKGRMDT